MALPMITRIHHINFLVRDLDAAVERYSCVLQPEKIIHEDLPRRGVKTARFRVGDTWIVLLQALDPDSVAGRHLAEHGEGFFLISYKVEDVEAASARARRAGVEVLNDMPRQGLADWRVMDLSADDFFAVNTQLVETG